MTSVALDFFGVRSERSQHKRKTDRLCCRCCAAAAYTLLVEYIFTDRNLIVIKTEKDAVLRKVFEALKTAAKEVHGVDFEPDVCVADASDAIRNAAENVWPDVAYVTCYPHIVQKVQKNEGNKVHTRSNVGIILEHLALLHLC